MAMTSSSIVEHLDVVEDIGLRQISRSIDPFSNALFLQTTKERLRDRVVPAVPSSTHARFEVVRTTKALPVVAAELRALIRVHEHALLRSTSPYRHHQRIEDEFRSEEHTSELQSQSNLVCPLLLEKTKTFFDE